GKIGLKVQPPANPIGGTPIGPVGGSVNAAGGFQLVVPAGALTQETVIDVFPTTFTLPQGFQFVGGALVNFSNQHLTTSALLSIDRPAGLNSGAQILLARVYGDPGAMRRLKLVGSGQIAGNRVAGVAAFAGVPLAGVDRDGEYVFLVPAQPLGLIHGKI